MNKFKTIDDINVKGKKIILRGDLNLPVKDGIIIDSTRMIKLLPTIQELIDKGGKVILISHFGRPKGEKIHSMSLKPLAKLLGDLLDKKIMFVNDCISEEAQTTTDNMENGEVILLENLRFYNEEERDDDSFAEKLAALGDIYINDAFSASHRAHASIHAITKKLPSYAGRLMEAELDALHKVLNKPKRPVAAIVGGAKISTKIDLLNNLVKKIDVLILGGGMANTFLSAQGIHIGKSLCEDDMLDTALQIMNTAAANNCKIVLPVDGVIASDLSNVTEIEIVSSKNIPNNKMMLDIGEDSIYAIKKELKKVNTVIWNGPMGAFENKPFDTATNSMAHILAELTSAGKIISVAGGGDTVAALTANHYLERMTYVSTGGGAFLEWLEGKELPGIKALEEN